MLNKYYLISTTNIAQMKEVIESKNKNVENISMSIG